MQTVSPTAIYLLSCLGTGNQHCQRNGAQITESTDLHVPISETLLQPGISHCNPCSFTTCWAFWECSGLARNEIVLPCDTWPPIPGRPPCLPAGSRFLLCCFRANLFLSHTEWTPVYNPLGWMRIESQCDKAISRQHCLSTGRIMNTIWNLNVFIRKTKWSQLKKASHNYQIKQLENESFYFCSYDTSSSC